MESFYMAESARELVVVMTHGTDHELSSVAFTIANGGMAAGLKVSVFLTSAAVDLVRKKNIDSSVPLAALVADFLKRGGRLWACTPCVKARGDAELLIATALSEGDADHGNNHCL